MSSTYNSAIDALNQAGKLTSYPSAADFPLIGQSDQLAIDKSTNLLYYWDNGSSSWIPLNADSAINGDYKPESPITLTSTDIVNKYIILPAAPSVKAQTRLIVIGGPDQLYGVDFTVTNDNGGQRLSWDGLGLDGILQNGDILLITYN